MRASASYDSPRLRPACGVRAATANVALDGCVATSFPKSLGKLVATQPSRATLAVALHRDHGSCHSPFITQMKGYREQQHCVEIALEFCAGGDLQALYDVQTGVLKYGSRQHSQFYMACAAMALQHLHERRFIYRDLKPENLLVDGAGCCKLCDMGHAKQVTREPRFQT